jgi:futalosine hydrolase
MRILVTVATAAELLPTQEVCEILHNQINSNFCIDAVKTGIGSTATAYHTLKALSTASDTPYDVAINVGIAGSFCTSSPIGSVVRVTSDCFGDCGIQTASGFQSLFDIRLLDADAFPFTSGKLNPPPLVPELEAALAPIPVANGITMQHLVEKSLSAPSPVPLADIETMEGAAFFYVCMHERIPCIALRAISNRAGERDKSKWNIPLALLELKKALTSFLHAL